MLTLKKYIAINRKHYNFIIDEQLQLMKALNMKNVLAKVEKKQKLSFDKSHRNWLLIDANCKEELELLTKVVAYCLFFKYKA